MKRIYLSESWTLQYGPQERPAAQMDEPVIPDGWETIRATVPGNVELDLIRARILPEDLERGDNIYLLREYESYQWWYTCSFNLGDLDPEKRLRLVFDGVDTLAAVWLNGKRIATLSNMLIPHVIDVGRSIVQGDNRLVIGIDSVVQAASEKVVAPGEWAMENNWESLSVRKAAHGFGWDIMPRVISAGLWRDVYLEQVDDIGFCNVYLTTQLIDVANRRASLVARWNLDVPAFPVDGWKVRISAYPAGLDEKVFEKEIPVLTAHGQVICDLEDVDLWWPRGYGDPSLYTIQLEAFDETGRRRAAWNNPFGLRTIRLDKSDTTNSDGDGKFEFWVNGEKIFVKGTNWVPLDALHSRDTEHLDAAMDMLVDLNCNMIRCWGGNIYESEAFFTRCDREGIMVWQDFSFACALYPQTPEFHDKVRQEAETIIPLLRNHCSLALWAGNNEIDAFYTFAKPDCDPNEDDQISRTVLASACRRLDPARDYLPSSPYYSPKLWEIGAPHEARPEDHLWGPRDDFKGPFYLSSNAHFVSEIGYHGCPDRSSLERMMTRENLWPWENNEEWLTHAVRPMKNGTAYNYRIPLMANQIKVLFGQVPEELDDFIFASQVSQAEALKFFIERFRMDDRRSGILWWNLRDGWPQISDAIVDYYGARKLAYPVIKRLQADVCVMLGEPENGLHPVIAVNDTRERVMLEVSVSDDGNRLLEATGEIPACGSVDMGQVPVSPEAAFYSLKWQAGGITGHNHYLAGPRPFEVDACRRWYGSVL